MSSPYDRSHDVIDIADRTLAEARNPAEARRIRRWQRQVRLYNLQRVWLPRILWMAVALVLLAVFMLACWSNGVGDTVI